MRQLKFRWWNGQKMIKHNELQVLARNLKNMEGMMQFTGLLDKEGREIYEGDIFVYGVFALNDTDKYGERPWDNLPDGVLPDDISTVLSTHKADYFFPSLMALKEAIENNPDVNGVEIIGNIYENPELILP